MTTSANNEQSEGDQNGQRASSEEVNAGKESVLEAYKNLLEATEHFKRAAKAAGLEISHEAGEQLLKGRDKAEVLGRQASDFVREKPLQALGIAFLIGMLVSFLTGKK